MCWQWGLSADGPLTACQTILADACPRIIFCDRPPFGTERASGSFEPSFMYLPASTASGSDSGNQASNMISIRVVIS